jgi:hypothetical protein
VLAWSRYICPWQCDVGYFFQYPKVISDIVGLLYSFESCGNHCYLYEGFSVVFGDAWSDIWYG